MNELPRPTLLALVYRASRGCNQYPFANVEEVEAWASRPPYRTETIMVCAVVGGKLTEGVWMPATKAADYLRQVGAVAV